MIWGAVEFPPSQPNWTVADAAAAYGVDLWSAGFFGINGQGHVVVRPTREADAPGIDLHDLVEDLKERGNDLPLLLRFSDILHERVKEVSGCFGRAIADYEYAGDYRGVYPIKVNQQAHVVEELLASGRPYHLGVEAGSKPELLVALAMLEDPEALIVCNGYKDEAYIETALLAQRLGRNPVLVMDRFRELEMTLRVAKRARHPPAASACAPSCTDAGRRGTGRRTGGSELQVRVGHARRSCAPIEVLRRSGHAPTRCELLHFHIGSQVPAIRIFKDALREASRIFVELFTRWAPG